MIISYFFIKEYKRVRSNNPNFLYLFYLSLGILFLIYEYFIAHYSMEDNFIFSIIPLWSFSFIIFTDRKLIFYLIPFALIGTFLNLYFNDYDALFIFSLIVIQYLLIFSIGWLINYSRINYFENITKNTKYIFSILLYLIIFSLLLYGYRFAREDIGFSDLITFLIYTTLIYFAFSFIIIYLFNLVDRLYLNYFNLSKNLFDKKQSYYKMALWKKQLNLKILNEKVSYGALIFLRVLNNSNDEINEKEILAKIYFEINKAYSDVFYFKSSSLYYSFFLPMTKLDIDLEKFYKNNNNSRREKDFFSNLEIIFSKYNVDKPLIKSYISIYGVDSNNIDDLTKYNESIMYEDIQENYKYPILLFNYRIFRNSILQRYKVSEAVKKYDNYNINYYWDTRFKGKIYFYNVLITKNKFKYYFDDFKEEYLNKNDANYLSRFFALNAIKNFSNEKFDKLVIYYPVSFLLQQEFNWNEFILKIKRNFSYPINKLIIGFKINEINEIGKLSLIANELKKLKKYNLNYAILDAENYQKKFDRYLKPYMKFKTKEIKIIDRFFDLNSV